MKKPSTEKTMLGKKIDDILGEEKAANILQDLAMVIAKYRLTRSPKVCDLLFDYLSLVIKGWNEE